MIKLATLYFRSTIRPIWCDLSCIWSGVPLSKLLLIIICMVSARAAAIAFDGFADAHIDLSNPCTPSRGIPSGLLRRSSLYHFVIRKRCSGEMSHPVLKRLAILTSFPSVLND